MVWLEADLWLVCPGSKGQAGKGPEWAEEGIMPEGGELTEVPQPYAPYGVPSKQQLRSPLWPHDSCSLPEEWGLAKKVSALRH